jgi:hypothetical protein
MPTRHPLKPYQRRALLLLAGCDSGGCAEAVMLAHGFTFQQLAELVREGFATATIDTDRMAGGQTFKITQAGLRTLGGQR